MTTRPNYGRRQGGPALRWPGTPVMNEDQVDDVVVEAAEAGQDWDPGVTEPIETPAQRSGSERSGSERSAAEQSGTGQASTGQAGSLALASAVMAAGTAVSRVLGFLRSFVLAAAIGVTGAAADAFALANTVPNMIYMLTAGGVLNAVLVPQIVRAAKQPDGGEDFTNRLVTWCLLITFTLTVLVSVGAPFVVGLYSGSQNPQWHALAVAFAYWCLPQVFFYAAYTVLGQVLNARGRFGMYMWAPVVNNVVALVGLAGFLVLYGGAGGVGHPLGTWTSGMVFWLAGTATLGVIAQAAVLLKPLRDMGFRFRPRFGLRGYGLGSSVKVAGWTLASVLVGQVALWWSTRVATGQVGDARDIPGLNAINLAFTLFMLPHSLVAVSLVTALFTSMSSHASRRDWAAIRENTSLGLRSIGVFTMLGSAALIVLATPIATMFQPGQAAPAVGAVIAARALGLVAFSATYLLQRVSYAYEDARTPFLTQLPGVLVVIFGTLIAAQLPADRVAVTISLAWACSAVLTAVLYLIVLRRQGGSLDLRRVSLTHARLLGAAVVAMVPTWLTVSALSGLGASRFGALMVCLIGGAVLTAGYLVMLKVLRVAELEAAVQTVRRRLRR